LKIKMPKKGYKQTEEHKRKRSLALMGRIGGFKGKHHSEEYKKKMSEIHKGSKNPFFGRHHAEKTKKRWRLIRKGTFLGERNPMWKGGIQKGERGYILIYKPNHPFCNSKGYVRRSHLVMEQMIGRYLKPKEVMHHINEITDDDRPENLQLFANNREHNKLSHHSILR